MSPIMRQVLCTTRSLCPTCLREVPASIVCEDRIYLEKECPAHGPFKVPYVWGRKELFRLREEICPGNPRPAAGLVLNLTTACNLHCPFCYMSANDIPLESMSRETIREYLSRFEGDIIYLGGGEPTIRPDLCDIIREVKKAGFTCALFTNGTKLADAEYVSALKSAGADLVIIQFDTLDAEICRRLRGDSNLLGRKLAAVENLQNERVGVYLFSMVVRGENEGEIPRLLEFARKHSDVVKILNFQPVWNIGRVRKHEPMTPTDIIDLVEKETGLKDDDFVQCTLFAYHLSECIGAVRGRQQNSHPSCETKCYLVVQGDEVVSLARILPLSRLMGLLKWYNSGRGRIRRICRLGIISPAAAALLLPSAFRSREVRKLLKALAGIILLGRPLISLPLLSLIVGTFPTAETIDLEMTRTCNLYSDLPETFARKSQGMASACVRQILMNRRGECSPSTLNELICTRDTH